MKRSVVLVLLTALLLSLVAPAMAASQRQVVEVSLVQSIEQIETRHIQELEAQAHNLENQPRDIRLVMAQVDYKGNAVSRAVSSFTLAESGTETATEHLKIQPRAYEVRVFAEDAAGSVISNIIHVPIREAFSVKDIQSIRDIQVTVPQWSAFTMPDMVEAVMYTGEVEYVAVTWDSQPDMTQPGVYRISGHVDGYSGQEAVIQVTVLASDRIEEIMPIFVTVDQGMRYTLPTVVEAGMLSGRTDFVPVSWEGQADTSQAGNFTYHGTVRGYDGDISLTLTVVDSAPSDIYHFQDEEIGEIIADTLGKAMDEITKADLASLKELNLSYLGAQNLEDLRYCTGLKSLTMWMTDVEDLSPLADLTGLEELDLYACSRLQNIAPLFGLQNLRTLKLNETAVEDFSPTAPYYDQLSDKDFTLSLLQADSAGEISLPLTYGQSYDMPLYIRLADGQIVPMAWDQQVIPIQNEGTVSIAGHVLGSNEVITVYCVISDVEDYPIEWHDEALEAGVRKAIDKPNGTVFYSDVKYLKELDCFALGIHSLEDLQHMHNLTYLGVAANYLDDSQWQYIKHLTKLEYLDVAMNEFTVIPAGIFDNMSNLIELCADENDITHIEPGAFIGQASLDTLMLEDNYHLQSIEEARYITHLKNLFIGRTPVSDLTPIADLNELEELWADECPVSDLSALKNKPELRRVKVGKSDNSGQISDISALAGANSLYWLDISGNQIEDISCLSGKSGLVYLEADDNVIRDISALANCPALETVMLSGNQIKDVAPLSNVDGIISLYLQDNKIVDVGPLANLTALKNLYLSGNQITDYSPLHDIYSNLIGKDFYA